MVRRWTVVAGIVLGLAAGRFEGPGSAWAQMSEIPAGASSGFYLVPSFSLTETYDDNIFISSVHKQSDFISRFVPGLRAGYQSEPFTLLGNYAFTSALYASHSSLDSPTESQVGGLTLKYRPTEVLSLNFDGAYAETSIPAQLNQPNLALLVPAATPSQPNPALPSNQAATSLLTTRERASYYSLVPSVGYRFDALDRGIVTYDYLVYQGGGILTTTHDGIVQFDREVTPQDTAILKGYIRHFETAPSAVISATSLDSYAATAGWKHRFTEQLDATVDAGPRFTVGTGIHGTLVDAEADATLNWRFQRGTASVGYARTELTAAGFGGTFRADSVFVALAVEPIRFLRLSVTPRWVQDTPEGAGTGVAGTLTTYSVDAGATYQLTRWLNARLNYSYYIEQVGRVDISRNLVTIGLDLAYPWRVY
jgi:hypothetical protein